MTEQKFVYVDANYLKELEETAKKVDYYKGIIDGMNMVADRKTEPQIHGLFREDELSDDDVKELKKQIGQIIEYADRKTEPNLTEIPTSKCHYEPKTEPQTCEECEHWNDTEDGCADRHGCRATTEDSLTFDKDINVRSKDEPQTDYTPDCPFCVRYGTADCLGSDCRHYKTYKDVPHIVGILFKGNLKEGDYKLIKTTNGWVLEGNDIAYYGEPQTEVTTDCRQTDCPWK